eukprot:scaffold11930_cov168-Isochrysis_galbana.AAC.2
MAYSTVTRPTAGFPAHRRIPLIDYTAVCLCLIVCPLVIFKDPSRHLRSWRSCASSARARTAPNGRMWTRFHRIIVWGRKQQRTTCKAIMTDPPTDDTEAREQDVLDTTDAKHRAPLHSHTGAVPLDKALSDTFPVEHPSSQLRLPSIYGGASRLPPALPGHGCVGVGVEVEGGPCL